MATLLERAIDWGTRLPSNHITYYYVPGGGGHASPVGNVATADFVPYEKHQFRLALELFESFLNVDFAEVGSPGAADLQFISYRANNGTLGAFGPPRTGPTSGIGVFNYAGFGWDYDKPGTGALEQGGYGYITIIHELGHGLGLAHPHDNGGGSPLFPGVTSSFGDYGDFDLNQAVVTMMSYNDGWKTNPDGLPPGFAYGFEGTPMALDIAVLQQKYGANWNYHTGNNVYRLPDANQIGTFYSSIWDAGGTDRIVSNGTAPALIDLHAATLEVEPNGGGVISHVAGIFGGFTIAHGVVIENAFGGSGPDSITGNGHANLLLGRGGDDGLIGGRGADRLSGGGGNDALTGNGGADAFLFTFPLSAVGNLDVVTDFVAGVDDFGLDNAIFAGIGKEGKLPGAVFFVGAAAQDADDRIGYNPATGALFYDADGSGAGAAIQFAAVATGLALASSDFIVI